MSPLQGHSYLAALPASRYDLVLQRRPPEDGAIDRLVAAIESRGSRNGYVESSDVEKRSF